MEYEIDENCEKFWILVITETFSRYNEVKVLTKLTTKSILRVFRRYFENHQRPNALLTDQGKQFVSREFKQDLSRNGIKHILNTSYNPTGNGMTERVNKEINLIMRMYRNGSMKEILRMINMRLNYTYQTTIKEIPIEILTKINIFTGKKINLNEDVLRGKNTKTGKKE